LPLDPTEVHARLARVARSLKWARALRCLFTGGAVAVSLLLLFLALDTAFHLGPIGRWLGFTAVLVALVAAAASGILAAIRPATEAGVARRIENSCAGAGNALISAVQLDKSLPPDSALRPLIFAELKDPFPGVDWRAFFDRRRIEQAALGIAAVAAIFLVWAALKPNYLLNSASRVLLPSSHIAPITRTKISAISPGDAGAVRGMPINISARLSGDLPSIAWIYLREPGGAWRREAMDHEVGSDLFTYGIPVAKQPLDYRIEAGDAVSEPHHIDLRPRTVITSRSAHIEPPGYTRLPAREAGNFSSLKNIPAGSKISITLRSNAPITGLSGEWQKGAPIETKPAGGGEWILSAQPSVSGNIRISFTDKDGVTDTETIACPVLPDAIPGLSVEIPSPDAEIVLSPSDTLRVAFTATDDFGLGEVSIYRSTAQSPTAEPIRSWPEVAGKTSFRAEADIPLSAYKGENKVTFVVGATDQNDVTGPGTAFSAPITVKLESAEEVQKHVEAARSKLQGDLRQLIEWQQVNLQATLAAKEGRPGTDLAPLLTRQERIRDRAATLLADLDLSSPVTSGQLRSLLDNEMPSAVTDLREAIGTRGTPTLDRAARTESAILCKLQGTGDALAAGSQHAQSADLITAVEDLLRHQQDIRSQTAKSPTAQLPALAESQDALATASVSIRKRLESASRDAASGDESFRELLSKAAKDFGSLRIYEDMLKAADRLQSSLPLEAGPIERTVAENLSAILRSIDSWRSANAARSADDLQARAKDLEAKLEKLGEVQAEIVEKSKELARGGEARAEDKATTDKLASLKAEAAASVEQMLKDAHIFPDLKPCNELRSQLTEIYEDVQQADAAEAAAGDLKPQEIAVQKEEGLLKAMEKAQELAADMEMWLPNKNETQQWNLENFDKTEMPDMQLPELPEAFEDIVGDLLKDQESIADQIQDAASNQLLSQNPANGWEIRDGPMGGFGAQGKSGNERPNQNEQTGRSSGGREGMSNGEMVGDSASRLEGRTPEVRRSNDPLQQGHVSDSGDINHDMATGGGKSGGLSDRAGMEGNAPLRQVNAPRALAADALAVEQAMLAEKTARTYATASLLYLKSGRLADTARLMEESRRALRENRIEDFRSLHQKIVASLQAVGGDLKGGNIIDLSTGRKASPGGLSPVGADEGQAPARYRDEVADYYRSLSK